MKTTDIGVQRRWTHMENILEMKDTGELVAQVVQLKLNKCVKKCIYVLRNFI